MRAILSQNKRQKPLPRQHAEVGSPVSDIHFDFDVITQPAPVEFEAVGLAGGLLRVRRVSTGVERLYAVDPGSMWFAEVAADLDHGRFGQRSARRHA